MSAHKGVAGWRVAGWRVAGWARARPQNGDRPRLEFRDEITGRLCSLVVDM